MAPRKKKEAAEVEQSFAVERVVAKRIARGGKVSFKMFNGFAFF